jgi:hypothetical protein
MRKAGPRGASLEVCALIEHRPAPQRIPVALFCIHFGDVLHPNVFPTFAFPYDIQSVTEAASQLAPNATSRYLEDLQGTKHEFTSTTSPQVHDCTGCCR